MCWVRSDGNKIRAVTVFDDALRAGDRIFVNLSQEQLHLFARESGKTLRRTSTKGEMATGENHGQAQLSAPSSKANVSDIDRRRFLKTTAGAAAGIAGSLSAPYVNAQSGVTLRILNAETTAASQSALRDACNEYESKFGVKTSSTDAPISGGYAKSMAAINAGAPYDIATAGYIAHILQYAMAGHIVLLTDLVKKYSWGKQGTWSYKGENWFYPYDYNLVTVFYEKDLYQEGDVRRFPNTWAEFLENCRALTVMGDGNIERGGASYRSRVTVPPIRRASATCLQTRRRSFMTTSGTSFSMRRGMPDRPAVFSIYMLIFIKRCWLA